MKRLAIAFATISLAVAPMALAGTRAAATEAAADQGGAVAAVEAFHAAMRRGDAAAAAALLADDLVVYEEGHVEASKAEYVAGHLPHDIAFAAVVPGESTRTRFSEGGDIAWVMREGVTRGTYKGRAIDKISSETMILRREADGWKIIHIHWSSHNAPPPAAS